MAVHGELSVVERHLCCFSTLSMLDALRSVFSFPLYLLETLFDLRSWINTQLYLPRNNTVQEG